MSKGTECVLSGERISRADPIQAGVRPILEQILVDSSGTAVNKQNGSTLIIDSELDCVLAKSSEVPIAVQTAPHWSVECDPSIIIVSHA